MLNEGIFISQATLRDIEECIDRRMNTGMQPVLEELQLFRELFRRSRPVITHKQATAFFDEEVGPATIIEYIKFRGLPARKVGRKWFLYLKDLEDWQIGKIGFDPKQDEPKVVAPRHEENETDQPNRDEPIRHSRRAGRRRGTRKLN